MSYFGFPRNDDGSIEVGDYDVLEAMELMINQLILLNERFEHAYGTGIAEPEEQ